MARRNGRACEPSTRSPAQSRNPSEYFSAPVIRQCLGFDPSRKRRGKDLEFDALGIGIPIRAGEGDSSIWTAPRGNAPQNIFVFRGH